LDPSSHLKKALVPKVQWRLWGSIRESNIKNVWLAGEKIRLTFDFSFFYDIFYSMFFQFKKKSYYTQWMRIGTRHGNCVLLLMLFFWNGNHSMHLKKK
jgi:hypothetical protein